MINLIKLKRASGHIELELGEVTAYLTYDQANTLGSYLIKISSQQVMEITLEPDQYKDVSEDGKVDEQYKSTLELSTMSRTEDIKSE